MFQKLEIGHIDRGKDLAPILTPHRIRPASAVPDAAPEAEPEAAPDSEAPAKRGEGGGK